MKGFNYQAYDSNGAKVEGNVSANSVEAATKQIKSLNLIPIKVTEIAESTNANNLMERKTVSIEELEFITSELAILLKNGVKIDKGLSILLRNRPSGPSAKLLAALQLEIKRGNSLSEAMKEQPLVFDALYVNLVKLGEESGSLPDVFLKLSEDLKFRNELKRKIIQSLTYPMVIFFVCILCILFIFNYIVPQMSGLFDGMPELPIYTELLLSVSQWMRSYQWFMFAGVTIGVFSLWAALKKPTTKRIMDDFLLKVPMVKNAVLIVERIRFNSALAMMLDAGISIDKALGLSADSVKNKVIRQGLIGAKEHVKKGAKLTESLAKSPIYPDFFISLLEVGEESGNLSPVFNEIAMRSRKSFETWSDKMTSILEPLLILTMGGIVGSVVVTMLLSIVSVNDLGI